MAAIRGVGPYSSTLPSLLQVAFHFPNHGLFHVQMTVHISSRSMIGPPSAHSLLGLQKRTPDSRAAILPCCPLDFATAQLRAGPVSSDVLIVVIIIIIS